MAAQAAGSGYDPDGLELLAKAIVRQAASDYREARRTLREVKSGQRREDALAMAEDAGRFFRSDWYTLLMDMDGETLLRMLDRQAELDAENDRRKRAFASLLTQDRHRWLAGMPVRERRRLAEGTLAAAGIFDSDDIREALSGITGRGPLGKGKLRILTLGKDR